MPQSKKRKRVYAPAQAAPVRRGPSPVWLAPLMLTLFAVGVVWLVLFYVTSGSLPVKGLGNGNLAVGFGFIVLGFLLATQWR